MQGIQSRRGLFSCLHSECDDGRESGLDAKGITEDLDDLIADFYSEALDRLPFEAMTDEHAEKLLTAMRSGSACVGLLDPVSNIILNTISALPRDFHPEPHPPHKKARSSKRPAGAAQPHWIWSGISRLSYHSLVGFLVGYFGCLTDKQAARYLHWARADLALAVLLVEHDLYVAEPQPPDPASGRTQAALRCGATSGRHPEPDALVRLHTSPLPQQRLLAAAPFLKPGGRNLTLDDVATVTDYLRYQETASLDLQVNMLPDGRGVVVHCRNFKPEEGKFTIHTSPIKNNDGGFGTVTVIKEERHGDYFASLRDRKSIVTSTILEKALKASHVGGSSLMSCGDECEYTESLRMRLHATIHALYLKAFTMLPSNVSRRLVRYILFAGHCYGPMDPVSNIIVNSIWHSRVFPLPSSDDDGEGQAYDILNALSMLRVEARSLKGLIALFKANFAEYCSTQRAMEHLCSSSCHLSTQAEKLHGFATAAEAAQHQQHAALGSFLSSLTPDMLDQLRPLLSSTTNNGTTLSSESLHHVECILTKELRETAALYAFAPEEAELCQVAKETVLTKRAEYKNISLFIRSQLAKLLKKYASENPQEPKYVPSVICGVIETYYSDRDSYHVNFVAASESAGAADNQLFFAEINVPCHQSKPNFCRPLCLTHTGRCYYGPASSTKIMYPASSDYFGCDITSYGIKNTERMIDADLVFNFRRDEQFVKDVVKYYEDQKALSEWS
uniref:Uncharacterized protein n=1 Tax=Avena sativa TaxID=4498 RepID=A0ACD5X977_AVESA